MSGQTNTYNGFTHIPNCKEKQSVYDQDYHSRLAIMDTLVELDGTDEKVHAAWVGKVGSAYVSGTQHHTSVKVSDLSWDFDVETDEEHLDMEKEHIFEKDWGRYALLRSPEVPAGAEFSRPFPQSVLTANLADNNLMVNRMQIHDDISDDQVLPHMMNQLGEKTVYVATSEPKLSGRVFANINDAREDGRILAELVQSSLSQKERDLLEGSRPKFVASLDQDREFKSDMAQANGSVASMALSRGFDVSTTAAMALMSGAKTSDDKVIQALGDRKFRRMSENRFNTVPTETIMDIRRNLERNDRESIMTLTAGAAALRKDDDLYRNQKASRSVMEGVEAALTATSSIDKENMAKFMAVADVVVEKSQPFIARAAEKSSSKKHAYGPEFF
jgi:hypothetical protein